MRLKLSSAKWRPFCSGGDEFKGENRIPGKRVFILKCDPAGYKPMDKNFDVLNIYIYKRYINLRNITKVTRRLNSSAIQMFVQQLVKANNNKHQSSTDAF